MYLVFDVGGTYIKHAMMNRDGSIVTKGKVKTPFTLGAGLRFVPKGLETFVDIIVGVYEDYKQEYHIEGIAMGLPGQVDVERGIPHGGGALPYLDGSPLADIISERCDGLKVALENDGKCAALSEIWLGNARNCNNAVVVVFGTGVGGGVIIDRKVLHGSGMSAGEFSFCMEDITRDKLDGIFLIEDNLRNNEGRRLPPDIIWTMKGSVHALRKKASALKGVDYEEMTGERIYELDEQGDPEIHELLEDLYFNTAKNCCNIHVILAPDIILIGGGISAQPKFIEGIQRYVDKISKLSIIFNKMKVGLCAFGNDSNLIGALYNYLQLYEGEK